MTNVVIVTHGEFGAYLLEAAEMIIGAQPEGVELVSVSPRVSVEEVREHIAKALEKSRSPDGIIVFTDIFGGTPTNMALPLAQAMPEAEVISGVNLNMLVSVFNYRGKMAKSELAKKIIEDGKKSICDVKALFAGAQKQCR